MRSLTTIFTLLLLSHFAHAQDAAPNWLEHTLYGSGKLNVVILVIGVILASIGGWMFTMDRRLKRMEDQLKK